MRLATDLAYDFSVQFALYSKEKFAFYVVIRKWRSSQLLSCIKVANVKLFNSLTIFTARCTSVQSAVLRSHVVCPSVCPSVTLVDSDHIGWNSSEIISSLVSLVCSLSEDSNIMGLLQGEHPEIMTQTDRPPIDLSVADIRSQIAFEWLQIAQRSQWRAYRKPPSLFRMVPSLTHTISPFPKTGSICPKKREWPYLRNGWSDTLHVWF